MNVSAIRNGQGRAHGCPGSLHQVQWTGVSFCCVEPPCGLGSIVSIDARWDVKTLTMSGLFYFLEVRYTSGQKNGPSVLGLILDAVSENIFRQVRYYEPTLKDQTLGGANSARWPRAPTQRRIGLT